MYKRLSAVLFPVVLVALIGAGIWGYQENREKNTILIKAENQYQRAFHDLSFHMNRLNTELGNTIAVNSTNQNFYRKGLINVWRITSQAQNEINQLPLTLLPFNKTEDFLDHISKFSYQTAVRDLNQKPLSQEEMKTLQTLYDRSKELRTDLEDVRSKVLNNHLRWMDVEVALASQKENNDNTIIDGFKSVDKKVSQYSEVDWGPGVNEMFQKRSVQMLSGNNISGEEAKKKVTEFLGLPGGTNLNVVENGNGTEYQSFTVTGQRDAQHEFHADVTKKGGKMIWFMISRDVPTRQLDFRAARDKAHEFLDARGFPDMTAVGYDEYQNIGSVTFAHRKDDVILYPEKLTVKVALDNGEIIGYQGNDFIFEQKERSLPKPTYGKDKAAKQLNPNLKINAEHMALIKNELDQDVLCYQFDGQMNGSHYRIFINAETGYEEKIDTLPPGTPPVKG